MFLCGGGRSRCLRFHRFLLTDGPPLPAEGLEGAAAAVGEGGGHLVLTGGALRRGWGNDQLYGFFKKFISFFSGLKTSAVYVFEEEAGRFARAKATFSCYCVISPPRYGNMFFDLQKDLPAPMSGHCMLTLPGEGETKSDC